MIIGLDPGTTQSGWVLLSAGKVIDSGVHDNHDVLRWVQAGQDADTLAIEMVASYGMAVGADVFDTVRWIGRFQQAWRAPGDVKLVFRKDVKLKLCGSLRAKDPNIRQALLDMFGPPGTKKHPGAVYGVKSHAWSALAVAVVASPKDAPAEFASGLFAAPQPKRNTFEPLVDEVPF